MPAGQPTSFRLSGEALDLIDRIESQTGLKRSAIVELAVREMAARVAKKQHATAPAKIPKKEG
jgi:hypothetical protein